MVIAGRVLSLKKGNDPVPIPIRIFAPQKELDDAWFCRYEIDWPDKKSTMNIGGADSTQALVQALQIIGAEIYASDYHKSGKLVWDKPGNGYGFPVAPSIRRLLQGDDAKYL
ncbi:MAG TPA: hypothetical protein VFB31_01370 [Pseudolabrys sp.]|nr:hypothetical protein [Pseudolabrys sp.]